MKYTKERGQMFKLQPIKPHPRRSNHKLHYAHLILYVYCTFSTACCSPSAHHYNNARKNLYHCSCLYTSKEYLNIYRSK